MASQPILLAIDGELGADVPVWLSSGLRAQLAGMATALDLRFLRSGEILNGAIDVLQALLDGLEDMAIMLDAPTDGGMSGQDAMEGLHSVAQQITDLPQALAQREQELSRVAGLVNILRDHAGAIERAQRILDIYGMNIKIAGVHGDFRVFVDEMGMRLKAGGKDIDDLGRRLAIISDSVMQVRQADTVLLMLQKRHGPGAARKIDECAHSLAEHLSDVSDMASDMAAIGREAEQSLGGVLEAIQVADCTRQRIEHVVAALSMVEEAQRLGPIPESALAYLGRLLGAQIHAASNALSSQVAQLEDSLSQLAATGSRLAALGDGFIDSDASLRDLESGILGSRQMSLQLCDAERRSVDMIAQIGYAVDDLARGIDSIDEIVRDVKHIAVNTRLLCNRHGDAGKAVAVVAVEVAVQARTMEARAKEVIETIAELSQINKGLHAQDDHATFNDPLHILSKAQFAIEKACNRSDSVIKLGHARAQKLSDKLAVAAEAVRAAPATVSAREQVLAAFEAVPILTLEAGANLWLAGMLVKIAGLYTMAAEREVHAQFLLPGMLAIVTAEANDVESSTDEDGFF